MRIGPALPAKKMKYGLNITENSTILIMKLPLHNTKNNTELIMEIPVKKRKNSTESIANWTLQHMRENIL